VDQREGDGWTALHCASRYGHLPVVKELIEQMDANVLLTLPDGMNAFHLAACGGHLNIVKYLVAKFSERMYDLDTMGNTILHWAAKEGHLNVVKYLVEECGFYAGLGNMDEQNALHQAASGGFLDIVKYLIPNCMNEMLNQTSRGNTCLHLAAQDGHLPVVKYLIGECGFDASLKNQGGKTALMIAMDKGHFDLIEYLTYQTRDGSGGFPDWVKRSKDVKVVSEMKKMSRLQWQTPQDALRSLFEDEDSDFESSALFIKHKPTEKTQEFMAQGVSSVLQPVSQGGSGDSQPPPTTAAGLQGHELLLLGKCWIPFGIQTLLISKNGGVFSLEPASDDVTESNTNIFQMEIPKDAIKQERLVVKYAIIFAGPLLLPEGYKFASPVVYIYLDYTALSKPVKLHVPHWIARVDSLCTDDVPLFISPHVMPENDNMYVFTAVDAADVEVNMGFSTVRLSGHNSLLGQAMRICYKKQSRYYASLWERTGDSEHTFRVAVVYGVPAWIKVLRKYLPRTHWKMSKTVVPQIFKFVADRITGCLQEASGCGWQATLTPPVVLQNSIEFKEYSSRENMKEAIKEDLYPPSLYAIVVQHFAAERYTVTKHMRMNISGTDLDPLLVPMRVMEVEDQGQIDLLTSSLTTSPSSQTSTSERQDFASKAFMDKYKNEFLASVAAKAIAMKLRMQDILPITVYHCVEHTDSESAKNLLFLHFQEEGTVLTILSLCDIMISVTGYPKMNALGRDMKADLTSCRFSVK
jgi:ankyrin repeat protein